MIFVSLGMAPSTPVPLVAASFWNAFGTTIDSREQEREQQYKTCLRFYQPKMFHVHGFGQAY
jgi:hypothetical protein